ncbi:MAG: HDIG domain-containing protein [FCB group bacterium]|nr:HDIG domain-containing protein [FCB group bacterium]
MIKKKNSTDRKSLPIWTISILVFVILFSALMAPRRQTYKYNYQVGDITRSDIIAPYDFEILKPQALIQREQSEALKKVAFVFTQDDGIYTAQIERAEQYFQMAQILEQRHHKYQQSRNIRNLERYSTADLDALNQTVRTDSNAYVAVVNAFREQFNVPIEDAPFSEIFRPTDGRKINLPQTRISFITHLSSLFQSGITDIPLDSILSAQISVRSQGVETPVTVKNVYDLASATEQLTENIAKDFDVHAQKILMARISQLLVRPNLIYDKERTISRQKDVINRIPLVAGKVYKDEKIVGANTLITQEIYQKLHSLNFSEDRRNANIQGFNAFLKAVGNVFIIGLMYMVFVIFLLLYNKTLFYNVKKFLLLVICMMFSLGLGSVIAALAPSQMVLVPMTVTAMLLMIFFDERIAMVGSAVIMLVLTYIFGGYFPFIIIHAFPVMMAIISFKASRSRENILRPLVFILAGYLITIVAMNISSPESFPGMLNMLLFASGNAIVSVLVTNGLVMVIERIFGETTALSLLELSDVNRPLLKRLSLEAPGTFNHSIMVGNLLETAAEKIGADSLLARVGAYYHDIGKLGKVEYFVENQGGGENKLDELKPHMAAKVIISHVRKGLELAEEEKLPDIIKDFIATHHGTMTVDYFYQKAKQESEENIPPENEFRYPGPLPTTKETGLLMIVEAAEAAVRSLKKASPRSIEEKIEDVIYKRMNTGQLDECPLNFADLTKIKKAIYPMLVGLYHERIPYPEDKKEDEVRDESKNTEEIKA